MDADYGNLELGGALASIPHLNGSTFHLLTGEAGLEGDAYLVERAQDGAQRVIAFIDRATCFVYPCDTAAGPNPRDAGARPLVKTTGDVLHGRTGQVTILQREDYYRRYSRWDRIEGEVPGKVVRTLPQCGCGGYLGAPMMFASFPEMAAYFFAVFSDAQKVDEQHACILRGEQPAPAAS